MWGHFANVLKNIGILWQFIRQCMGILVVYTKLYRHSSNIQTYIGALWKITRKWEGIPVNRLNQNDWFHKKEKQRRNFCEQIMEGWVSLFDKLILETLNSEGPWIWGLDGPELISGILDDRSRPILLSKEIGKKKKRKRKSKKRKIEKHKLHTMNYTHHTCVFIRECLKIREY